MTDGKAKTLPPLRPAEEGAPVTLSIDGRDVKARTGDTILKAAKSIGIKIPHLCILKELTPFGGCRVCIVEIEGMEGPAPSCSTYVEDGMRVITESERLARLRKTYLELLLSDHNAYCLPPCKYGCPTRVDAPAFLQLMVEGDYEESQRVLKENLPFPAIVGRICPHPCEPACRRGEVEEPISIRLSHRFIGDVSIENGFRPEKPAPATGKRVAVIGSGPAGLSNAYYLALKGHAVTIFEELPEPGGMLRYGIPEYRLPKQVLDAELEPLWDMGVELRTRTCLGPDCTIDSLLDEEGFDTVFLGIGAHESRRMRVEGEDLEGMRPMVEFLRQVALGDPPDVGEKVAVIGGGFSAMDAARTSIRLGAKEVTVIYRRTQAEMPAHEIEVRDGAQEGVNYVFLAAPVKVEGRDGKVTGVWLQKMELGEPDESGRRRPQPVEGSEYLIEIDTIIPAIGQVPKLFYSSEHTGEQCTFLDEADTGIKCTKWQTISANPKTLQTDRPEVFTGGDAYTGALTVVAAIAAGKQAAWAMDAYMRGEDMAAYEAGLPEYETPPMIAIPAYRPETADRKEPAHLEAAHRKTNFQEVEQGFAGQHARAEGSRCLQCICEAVEYCKLRQYSIDSDLMKAEGNRFEGPQHIYGRDTRHPFIQRDPNRCIDCGRCVRVCKYWTGAGVYELTGRGPGTIAATPFDVPLEETDCVSCGRCAWHCPTGALFARKRVLKDWHLDTARCIFCADCVEVCPVDALAITQNFELAGYRHEDLSCHLLERAQAREGGGAFTSESGRKTRGVPGREEEEK
ncbi:MAG: FAD-dependent oxidoreductase [Thermoleophilia bacterium]|nr:FAD-dependent oxidoreductase [Thermoleophilia bacterium]